MKRYILNRLFISLVLVILSSVLVFVLLRVIPGSPVLAILGGSVKDVSPKAIDALDQKFGLNHPLYYQYWAWLRGVAEGNFGKSYSNGYPVSTLISEGVAPTLELAIGAVIVALVVSVPLATLGSLWRSRWIAAVVSGYNSLTMSIPAFVTGICLIVVFGVEWHLLPTSGYVSFKSDPGGSIRATILPAVALGIAVAAPLLRMLRASLKDVDTAPFIRTATGKGLQRGSVVWRHLLPNALIPALTTLGVIVGSLLGGAVVVEYVFARQGLGTLLVSSVLSRDYPTVQALVLLAAVIFILTSMVIDLAYLAVDPRLRLSKAH